MSAAGEPGTGVAGRRAVAEYLVRIVAPEGGAGREVEAEARRALRATLEHRYAAYEGDERTNLQRIVEAAFVRCVDQLGEAGFTVEVVF
jgi:hypothetical protein